MVELSEDELSNFGKVWAAIFVSLSYCYSIGKLTSKGLPRFIAILPIIALFLALPLKLTSFHLGGLTAFFIAWLANFKLLLFAFGKPPLISSSNSSSISYPHFIALASFPIKLQQNDPPLKNPKKSQNNTSPDQKSQNKHYPSPQKSPKTSKSASNYIIKGALLALIVRVYDYSDYIHPKILWLIYFFHIYFALEITLALLAKSVKFFLGCELEPPFDEPLLSTSLQDFWGRRWNIMVTRILRPTVYLPVLDYFTGILGRRWAALPAVMATFVVSGVMHELIFYYLGHLSPTFEVTWFFLLHGFCLCLEIVIKKAVDRKWSFPAWVSGPATAAFVVATGFWLFLPPLLRAGLDTRAFEEYAAFGRFVKSWWRFLNGAA